MKYIIAALLLIACVLQLIRLALLNNFVPITDDYVKTVEETAALRHENALLHEAILQKEALGVIRDEAKKRGFVQGKLLYLKEK